MSKSNKINIVLYKSLRKKGKPGDIVAVSAGFANNKLIPTGAADFATKANIAALAVKRSELERVDREETAKAQKLKESLADLRLVFFCKVRDNDNIYGSIQARELEQELAKQGYDIKKSSIKLTKALKTLGLYDVELELYGDIGTTIKAELKPAADRR